MKNKAEIIILLLVAALIYFLYLISEIMMPFFAALFFAYMLNPLVARVERLKVPRTAATLVVTVSFFIVLLLIIMMIMPPLYKQSLKLVERINSLQTSSYRELFDNTLSWLRSYYPAVVESIDENIDKASSYFLKFAGGLLNNLVHSGMLAFHIISLLIITPIVTYYVLRDWPKMVKSCDELIPKKYSKDSHELLGNMNRTLSSYLRGQTLICILLGIFYAIGLEILGVSYGVVLGLMSGIFTFIPYIGAIFGAILCTLLALIQFADLSQASLVLLLFIAGQFIEGNFVAPRILGKSVGLSPIWVMFGLLAGGVLFGFFGILIAVPLTAMLGVIIKFVIKKYKQSRYYSS